MNLDFIIMGAQKSGSTFLHKCLSQHPKIRMPNGEVAIFERTSLMREDIDSLIKEKLPNIEKCDVVGIKRPNLLCNPVFPEKVMSFFPNVKLIGILRDPIDRVVSAYHHLMRNGFLPVEHIESGLPKIISGEYLSEYWRAFEILDFSHYKSYLLKISEKMPLDNIFLGHFNNLTGNPDYFLSSVMEFLEVPVVRIDHKRIANEKPQSVVYPVERLKVLTLENHILAEVDGRGCINKDAIRYSRNNNVRKKNVDLIKKFDKEVLAEMFGNDKPILSNALREQLEEIFCADIEFTEVVRGGGDWKKCLMDDGN